MKNRLLVLAGIVALGSSIAAFQAPAPQQAPVVGTAVQLDVVKLKDNFYVITSSSPTPRETFSGRSPESMTPRTNRRYIGSSSSASSMMNTRRT